MDKKSKDLIRKHKKIRPASSSDSSSSSDSDSGSSSSYSSSSSDRKAHRKGKKNRARRSSSSSDDERARKKHACHRKLEAKKLHLKRKLKEAKLRKRGLSPGGRHRSETPQQKLKKNPIPGSLAEKKKHHQMILKERMLKEREREKIRLNRERERLGTAVRPTSKGAKSRSPSKALRCRVADIKRNTPVNVEPELPPQRHHHQISPREKIIIQARRDRSPSERSKGQKDIRHRLDDRRERERADAARQKERDEALARCQERQRERERIAREKIMRRDNKDFDRDRLLPRPAEREMALAAARAANSRERSIETDVRRSGHSSHGHTSRQSRTEVDYDRENYERDFPDRDDVRGGGVNSIGETDREYVHVRRRGGEISPENLIQYSDRDIYHDEERYEHDGYASSQKHGHSRNYLPPPDESISSHHRRGTDRGAINSVEAINWNQKSHREHDGVGRDHEKHFPDNKRDWKSNKDEWDDSHWQSPKQSLSRKKPMPLMHEEESWDNEDGYSVPPQKKPQNDWNESKTVGGRLRDDHGPLLPNPGQHDASHIAPHQPHLGGNRRWQQHEWRGRGPNDNRHIHVPGGPVQGNYRHNAPMHPHPMDYGHERPDYRRPQHHHLPHMQHHHLGGFHHQPRPHFPTKRQMTYTNPNLLQNQKISQLALTAVTITPLLSHQSSTPNIAINTTGNTTGNNATKSIATPAVQVDLPKSEEPLSLTVEAIPSADTANATADKPSAVDVKLDDGKNSENINDDNDPESKNLECGEIVEESSTESVPVAVNAAAVATGASDEIIPDDLSEISDEADEILNKDEELAKNLEKNKKKHILEINNDTERENKNDLQTTDLNDDNTMVCDQIDKDLHDDLLGFEEISDGELEEESRKNLGDALGVDWASLMKDSRVQDERRICEQYTTAKQKWQPHRIILDIGISFKYAGEEFAKRILNDAKQKLKAEQELVNYEKKTEVKVKIEKADDTDVNGIDEDKSEIENKAIMIKDVLLKEEDDCEKLSDMACIQVALRRSEENRKNLVFNACGPNSRALSARRDLELRRQLCGLPIKQIDRKNKISEKMKALAVQAFQKAVVGKV